VSAFVGDQFDQTNKARAKVVYDAFYWSINFGSIFASLLIPKILVNYGPEWAFGIPGILMFIATGIFWMGRRKYVHVPPAPRDPHSFTNVVRTALTNAAGGRARPGLAVANAGFALGMAVLVSWAMSPDWWPEHFGFVISVCLALGSFLAGGSAGTAMQLERARGLHPSRPSTACARCCAS
jgi:POT family proton-dependent oligopeptide transporter